jgi:hypothetical protein
MIYVTCVRVYVCACLRLCVFTFVRVYVCACLRLCVFTFVRVYEDAIIRFKLAHKLSFIFKNAFTLFDL